MFLVAVKADDALVIGGIAERRVDDGGADVGGGGLLLELAQPAPKPSGPLPHWAALAAPAAMVIPAPASAAIAKPLIRLKFICRSTACGHYGAR